MTEEVSTSEEVITSDDGSRVKEDRADRNEKANTPTWFNMVKGLKVKGKLETTNSFKEEDESETADSVECRNESDVPDSIEMFDS